MLPELLCSVGANDCRELRLKLLRVFASGVMFEETQVVCLGAFCLEKRGEKNCSSEGFPAALGWVGNEEIALNCPAPARSLRRKARWMVAIPAVKA